MQAQCNGYRANTFFVCGFSKIKICFFWNFAIFQHSYPMPMPLLGYVCIWLQDHVLVLVFSSCLRPRPHSERQQCPGFAHQMVSLSHCNHHPTAVRRWQTLPPLWQSSLTTGPRTATRNSTHGWRQEWTSSYPPLANSYACRPR